MLSPLENFLVNTLIVPIVNKFLGNFTFGIYKIPPIHVPLGPGFNITLANVQTEELNPAGNALLVAHGAPTIS
jgi:hypothetical protein